MCICETTFNQLLIYKLRDDVLLYVLALLSMTSRHVKGGVGLVKRFKSLGSLFASQTIAMNTLFRPGLRPVVFRKSPFILRPQLARPVPSAFTLYHRRLVASSVSNRPGSQTLEHAATNIKEEVGNSAADLAKVIAGANVKDDPLVPEGSPSFASAQI